MDYTRHYLILGLMKPLSVEDIRDILKGCSADGRRVYVEGGQRIVDRTLWEKLRDLTCKPKKVFVDIPEDGTLWSVEGGLVVNYNDYGRAFGTNCAALNRTHFGGRTYPYT